MLNAPKHSREPALNNRNANAPKAAKPYLYCPKIRNPKPQSPKIAVSEIRLDQLGKLGLVVLLNNGRSGVWCLGVGSQGVCGGFWGLGV